MKKLMFTSTFKRMIKIVDLSPLLTVSGTPKGTQHALRDPLKVYSHYSESLLTSVSKDLFQYSILTHYIYI